MSGHPAGTPWATVDELRRRHDEAAKEIKPDPQDERVFHPGLGRYVPLSLLQSKPERDPATTPVVGDEWTNEDYRGNRIVKGIEDGDVIYERVGMNVLRHPVRLWKEYQECEGWTLHRRGDDPDWRPEGERSETPDAAIDPDDTEQPEPIEDIDRNPHTEPMVGDEWEDEDEDALQVIYVGDDSVVMWNDDYKYASQWSRKEFAEESFVWRFSKAADLQQDDTGDEPPTPAFEGDPSAERFTTYQPTPNFFREHGDDDPCDAYESVDHPPHYGGDSPHEVIKFIEAHDLGFNAGNVVKYVVRAGRKPGEDKVKDLEKAVWYLNRIVAAAKGTT